MKSVFHRVLCIFAFSIIITDIPVEAFTPSHFIHIAQSPNIGEPIDLSRTVITLEDLPTGFQEIQNLTSPKSKGEFAFLRETSITAQIIVGYTDLQSDNFEKARLRFTKENRQDLQKILQHCLTQDNTAEFLSQQLGRQVKTLELKELRIPNDIGDISLGETRLIEMLGRRPRMDRVVFVRGRVMSLIVVVYFEDDVAAVPIVKIARKLDNRIQQHLQ